MYIYIYHDKRTHCIYGVERNRSELNSSNEPVWGRRQIWDLQIWWTQSLFETTAAIHMLDSTNLKCAKWTNFIFRVQQATPHIVLSNWSLESHGLKRIWVKSAVYSWNLPPLVGLPHQEGPPHRDRWLPGPTSRFFRPSLHRPSRKDEDIQEVSSWKLVHKPWNNPH